MRYWVHATVTGVFSIVAVIGGAVAAVVMAIALPIDTPRVVGHIAMAVPVVLGFFLPSIIMTRVPFVCPKCGGRGKYGFAAFGNWFMPTYAWSCRDCDWSTYRWSAYYQRKYTRKM